MVVVAGPPGSGKSTAFPVYDFGLDYFNADDRAAQLNGGSYLGISLKFRKLVNEEFERFITQHIKAQVSFVFETTLRTDITLEQVHLATQRGFHAEMIYISAGCFEECLTRVIARGLTGGHSAPVAELRTNIRCKPTEFTERAPEDARNKRL